MNKDQIHGELGNFSDILQIQSNCTRNFGEKLWNLIDLEGRLQDESMESKIMQFISIFIEK